MAHHATPLIKLQEGSLNPASTIWVDTGSWKKSLKLYFSYVTITSVITIREDEHRSLSSSKSEKRRAVVALSVRHVKKTPSTVALILQQQQALGNRSLQNTRYCILYLNMGYQAEKCPVRSLKVMWTSLQQRKNDKAGVPYKRNYSTPQGRYPHYQDPINPTYRPPTRPTVLQGVSNMGTIYQAGSSSSCGIQKKGLESSKWLEEKNDHYLQRFVRKDGRVIAHFRIP